jgi:3-dehydroquinate dehydratase-1
LKPIELKGREPRMPLVCAPLVGRTREALLAEAALVSAKRPDLLEWRVDFFEGLGDASAVARLAGDIKRAAGGMPLLFTRRNAREGGEKIALSEAQVVEVYRAVCEAGGVDLVDFEMGNSTPDVVAVRGMSRARGIGLVLSFHDFQGTPPAPVLAQKFAQAEQMGADVAKVAVMPRSAEDVLTLLSATLQASRALDIPVVSMAMGGLGAVSRVCGASFGSALTFAVGQSASAPGQMPIEDLSAALAVLRKAGGGAA